MLIIDTYSKRSVTPSLTRLKKFIQLLLNPIYLVYFPKKMLLIYSFVTTRNNLPDKELGAKLSLIS